ncbi:hypothetical protein BD410DRAFT_804853 [Rickenella mellea]|uniref:Uncharacterized protein n=1 Tax=Rickenella mellea TaxID=50990 RepID=A0A4Y7Q0A8_9AGAM|nr:hypothetical protein BD410DRAFT_804853 [Rickenella mellea]
MGGCWSIPDGVDDDWHETYSDAARRAHAANLPAKRVSAATHQMMELMYYRAITKPLPGLPLEDKGVMTSDDGAIRPSIATPQESHTKTEDATRPISKRWENHTNNNPSISPNRSSKLLKRASSEPKFSRSRSIEAKTSMESTGEDKRDAKQTRPNVLKKRKAPPQMDMGVGDAVMKVAATETESAAEPVAELTAEPAGKLLPPEGIKSNGNVLQYQTYRTPPEVRVVTTTETPLAPVDARSDAPREDPAQRTKSKVPVHSLLGTFVSKPSTSPAALNEPMKYAFNMASNSVEPATDPVAKSRFYEEVEPGNVRQFQTTPEARVEATTEAPTAPVDAPPEAPPKDTDGRTRSQPPVRSPQGSLVTKPWKKASVAMREPVKYNFSESPQCCAPPEPQPMPHRLVPTYSGGKPVMYSNYYDYGSNSESSAPTPSFSLFGPRYFKQLLQLKFI